MSADRTSVHRRQACSDVSIMLAAAAEDASALAPVAEEHVASCLSCQAEFAQYRKILRTMKSLRADLEDPGDELLDDVLDLLRPPASVHKLRRGDRRKVYLGGIAAGAAGAAAGAIVLASWAAGGRRLAS